MFEAGRKRKVVVIEDGDTSSGEQPMVPKPTKKAKKSASAPPKVTVIQVEDTDERPDTKRGPSNSSRNHFHPPVPITSKGNLRWEFKCRHCKTRTVGNDATFVAENP
ncbi:hypothetical protein B0H14DRAFT_3485782 [Mycena olivaceomarginata]|nr:hypothetical protein B0H14DRAFT_3485782 [Mycena olivaceomarginata]